MSLFTNLLNLHLANKPLEDFFTEIVAYFLSLNNDILIDWLKHHSIISDENYSSIKISTQQEHKGIESHTEDSRFLCLIKFKITTTTTTFKIYDFLERCRKNKGINSTTYTTIRYLQITPVIIAGVICRYLVEIVYNVKPLPNIRCRRCKRHKRLISWLNCQLV